MTLSAMVIGPGSVTFNGRVVSPRVNVHPSTNTGPGHATGPVTRATSVVAE
jgi:hypothetical protein